MKKMLEELDAEARNEGEVEAVREIAAEGWFLIDYH